MDVQRVESFLRQIQNASPQKNDGAALDAFQDLLKESADQSKSASKAAEEFLTTGKGELHQVQVELAKADLTFRFLVEVRNKLTEAYQEISRLNI